MFTFFSYLGGQYFYLKNSQLFYNHFTDPPTPSFSPDYSFSKFQISTIPHLFEMHFLYPHKNIRKPYGFLMFSGGRERVHWERMRYLELL